MKHVRILALLLTGLLTMMQPARAQHAAMHHDMESAPASGDQMMGGMMNDPLHTALMDLLAVPALSVQLSLTPLQEETIGGIVTPVLDAAKTVPALVDLGPAPSADEVRTTLADRDGVLVQAYAASGRIRDLLSGTQRQTYSELDPETVHGAATAAEGHRALMTLLGGCSGMQMNGMMHDGQGMMHGDNGTMPGKTGMMHGDTGKANGGSGMMHGDHDTSKQHASGHDEHR